MKKNNQSLSSELRTLQEKLTRQSGALSTGLSDLKSHLDQKDLEKHQSVSNFYYRLHIVGTTLNSKKLLDLGLKKTKRYCLVPLGTTDTGMSTTF